MRPKWEKTKVGENQTWEKTKEECVGEEENEGEQTG